MTPVTNTQLTVPSAEAAYHEYWQSSAKRNSFAERTYAAALNALAQVGDLPNQIKQNVQNPQKCIKDLTGFTDFEKNIAEAQIAVESGSHESFIDAFTALMKQCLNGLSNIMSIAGIIAVALRYFEMHEAGSLLREASVVGGHFLGAVISSITIGMEAKKIRNISRELESLQSNVLKPLSEEGISPKDIDNVLFTHFDPELSDMHKIRMMAAKISGKNEIEIINLREKLMNEQMGAVYTKEGWNHIKEARVRWMNSFGETEAARGEAKDKLVGVIEKVTLIMRRERVKHAIALIGASLMLAAFIVSFACPQVAIAFWILYGTGMVVGFAANTSLLNALIEKVLTAKDDYKNNNAASELKKKHIPLREVKRRSIPLTNELALEAG